MPDAPSFPNRLALYFFHAMRDVVGQHGLNTILTLANLQRYSMQFPPDDLDRAFPFTDMAALSQALETMYGVRGGRGMAERVGRAWLSHGLMTFGALAGFNDPAYRALPHEHRARLALLGLAETFNRHTPMRCRVEDMPGGFRFIVEESALAYERTTERPACAALQGLIHELLRWAANGGYNVQEIACSAARSPVCIFVVR